MTARSKQAARTKEGAASKQMTNPLVLSPMQRRLDDRAQLEWQNPWDTKRLLYLLVTRATNIYRKVYPIP